MLYTTLANVTPFHFWSLADHFPDLVSRLHVQVRLMGQFGPSGGIPRLRDSDGAFCFVCKQDVESVTHFLLDCSYSKQNFLSLCRNLKIKITVSNQADGVNICQFINDLDRHHKVLLLLGGLCLPFDKVTNTLIKRFIAKAMGRIHKFRRERLCELKGTMVNKKVTVYNSFFSSLCSSMFISFVRYIDFKIDCKNMQYVK